MTIETPENIKCWKPIIVKLNEKYYYLGYNCFKKCTDEHRELYDEFKKEYERLKDEFSRFEEKHNNYSSDYYIDFERLFYCFDMIRSEGERISNSENASDDSTLSELKCFIGALKEDEFDCILSQKLRYDIVDRYNNIYIVKKQKGGIQE